MNGQTMLNQVGTTNLYTASNGPLAFLLANDTSPPPQLTLDSTWSTSGPPQNPGYYLFLTTPPATSNAAALQNLPLPAPTATGCVWVNNSSPKPRTLARILITAEANQLPSVATSMAFPMPRGMPSLGIAANTLVNAIYSVGGLAALTFAHPPIPGVARPTVNDGIALGLGGLQTGSLQFTGLLSIGLVTGNSARKQVVQMTINPLDPLGSSGFVPGWSVVLGRRKKGYRLSAAR